MTRDDNSETPLHYACHYGHLNIVQYLISELHCDPMTNDDNSETPLHYTCHYGHLNIVQYLINEQHCDPKTTNKNSWTPLHNACQNGYLNIAQYHNFKQYHQIASNTYTGIVPIATLEKLFPQYSSEMLVGCLESMEFCHPLDPTTLQATNLEPCSKATSSSPLSGANHLFFPSLIKEQRPGNLPSPRFGWCLGCSNHHQFFSNRFLHVLLLRLAIHVYNPTQKLFTPFLSVWFRATM